MRYTLIIPLQLRRAKLQEQAFPEEDMRAEPELNSMHTHPVLQAAHQCLQISRYMSYMYMGVGRQQGSWQENWIAEPI